MKAFSDIDKQSVEYYCNLIKKAGKEPADYIGTHSRFLHQSCDNGDCFGQDILLEKFEGGRTYAVKKSVKVQYINFTDREGVKRLSIATGEAIPPGYIIGKGWTVTTSFKDVLVCRCGKPEHAHDIYCDYNDH